MDLDTFARPQRADRPGFYRKAAPMWAGVADRDGAIATKEGVTHYRRGDFLVFNDEQGQDGYAVNAPSFEAMYTPAE